MNYERAEQLLLPVNATLLDGTLNGSQTTPPSKVLG